MIHKPQNLGPKESRAYPITELALKETLLAKQGVRTYNLILTIQDPSGGKEATV